MVWPGSTWSVIGNPQIALIVSKTGVQFSRYLKHMALPTVVVTIVHIGLLHLSYKKGLFRSKPSTEAHSFELEQRAPMLPTCELDAGTNDVQEEIVVSTDDVTPTAHTSISLPAWKQDCKRAPAWFTYCIGAAMLATVILLLLPSSVGYFDLGLVPFAAGLIIVVIDKLCFNNDSSKVFNHLDWPVLLLFMGLFVWLQGLTLTQVPARIWCALLPSFSASTPSGVLLLSIFMVVGSNIVSNVPLVVLIAEKLPSLASDVLNPALLAAWTTTVGGWCC